MIRSRFSGREYRQNWPCVSSKKGYHDVVGVSRETKMGDREVKDLDIDKVAQGLSSITLIIFIFPEHFGHVSGSTFPDQVRDRLQFSE